MNVHRKFLLLAFVFNVQTATVLGFPDENTILDRLLQIVWDPSALVYAWTALDQLYYVILSWRLSALNAATLPFREPKSMGDSIRFNGRDLAVGRIKSRPIPTRSDRARKTFVKPNQPFYPPPHLPYPLVNTNHLDFLNHNHVHTDPRVLKLYQKIDERFGKGEPKKFKDRFHTTSYDIFSEPVGFGNDLIMNTVPNIGESQFFSMNPDAKLKLLLQLLGELNPLKTKKSLQ